MCPFAFQNLQLLLPYFTVGCTLFVWNPIFFATSLGHYFILCIVSALLARLVPEITNVGFGACYIEYISSNDN